MDKDDEICAICRENGCNFETRCGHFFHKECLNISVFSTRGKKCPYCRQEISSFWLLEKLIREKGDFSFISLEVGHIEDLKDFVKYGLKRENIPLVAIVKKMVELGWDMNELGLWLDDLKEYEYSLFYASYISGKTDLTHKLIEMGCRIYNGKGGKSLKSESVIPHAAKINDIPFIKKLIELGADINSLDFGKSALSVACETDNVEMSEFLLENGAKVLGYDCLSTTVLGIIYGFESDISYSIKNSALITAYLNGSLNIIRHLIRRYPSLLKDDKNVSWEAFAIAIHKNNIPLISLLTQWGGELASLDSQFGRNLFMVACAFGNVEVVKYLFEVEKFDVNFVDSLGNSAIIYSTNVEIVKFLIENGADPFAVTLNDNFTILHVACLHNNYDLLEYLLDRTPYAEVNLKRIPTAKKGLIELVIYKNKNHEDNVPYDIIDFLLEKGADINEKQSENLTVFSQIHGYSHAFAQTLLSRGADVNSVDSNGMSCLHHLMNVESKGRFDENYLTLLVNNGIDLNLQDNRGWTAMHYTCGRFLTKMMFEYLLDSGARMDIPNNEGLYPFDMAVKIESNGEVVKFFENREVNFSKYIPDKVKSKSCYHCKRKSASLKARCGHFIHLSCLKYGTICPLCETRVTISCRVENIIIERKFDDLSSLSNEELFILLDNYIENEQIIDSCLIKNELNCRKDLMTVYSKHEVIDQLDVITKAHAFGRSELASFFKPSGPANIFHNSLSSAFFLASCLGNNEIVEYLIGTFGAEYINKEYCFFYPIHFACLSRNTELFDIFVENRAKLDIYMIDMDLLSFACNAGSFEIVKRLVEQHGFTAVGNSEFLHNAVKGSKDSDYLLRWYPFKNSAHLINLQEKSEEESIEIANFLLNHGADMNAYVDDLGATSVSLTGLYNHEKLFDFFVNYCRNVLKKSFKVKKHKNILISIAKCGKNLQFFEKIIEMGADVNWTDGEGCSALMAACSSGNFEMCSRLIELGADINAVDNEQYTVLYHLFEGKSDSVQILDLLVGNGADVHYTAQGGVNALIDAALFGRLNIVKKLLAMGFDPNSNDDYLQTPLHALTLSVLEDDVNDFDDDVILAVAKVLVEAGAEIFAADDKGSTPHSIATNNLKLRKIVKYFNEIEALQSQS